MEIAFATLLVFVLLIPGLLFFRFYYSGYFSKQFIKTTAFEVFYMSLTPGIIIQCVGIILVNHYHPYLSIDLELISSLLLGQADDNDFNALNIYLPQILIYNLALWIASCILGNVFLLIVRKGKIDRIFKIFRFQNQWHYLLNAELEEISSISKNNVKKRSKDQVLAAVYMDALVDTTEGAIIYKGIIADYLLSKEGGLDLIYLTKTKRRNFSKNEITNEDHVIPGIILL